jgi:hypothetical protein
MTPELEAALWQLLERARAVGGPGRTYPSLALAHKALWDLRAAVAAVDAAMATPAEYSLPQCDCGYSVRGSRLLAHWPDCALVAAERAAFGPEAAARSALGKNTRTVSPLRPDHDPADPQTVMNARCSGCKRLMLWHGEYTYCATLGCPLFAAPAGTYRPKATP